MIGQQLAVIGPQADRAQHGPIKDVRIEEQRHLFDRRILAGQVREFLIGERRK